MLKALRLAAPIVAIALLAGCEDPEPGIGLELAPDNESVLVEFKPCRDETVMGIRLTSGGEVLYEATATEGQAIRSFTLGQPVGGFDVVVPLTSELAPLEQLRLSLRTSAVPDEYINFDFDELKHGEILVRYRGYMTAQEFENHSSCDSGGWLS